MKMINWMKGALCLMALAALGNALGAEQTKNIIQWTKFDSKTDIPYAIPTTNVDYLVWNGVWGANFGTRVKVVDPKYIAPPEPLFNEIGHSFAGYAGRFLTASGNVEEHLVFDKDGHPAEMFFSDIDMKFNPPTELYAKWHQDPFGKERILYFLARFITAARDGGNGGAQREIEKYSQQIKDDPMNWEAYVNRSFARFVTLWDDLYIKSFAERSGLDVVNPVLHFGKQPPAVVDGKIIEPLVPLSYLINQIERETNIDKVCGSALPIIESAIADLDAIPETWSGAVAITAANTGYPFDKHKTYNLDYADVQMIKAIFRALMSFLELARGYNPHSADVEPDGVNRKALAAAREYYLKAVEMLRAFNAARNRRPVPDFYDHLFMLIPYESRLIGSFEQALLDLPWWTTEIQLDLFVEMCFKKDRDPLRRADKQWKNPIAESDRKRNILRGKRLYLSLRSLFNGEVSRAKGTFPQFINNSAMLAKSYGLTDPTFAGTFPEMTRNALGEFLQIFEAKVYDYEPETSVKYHAVVYKLPAGATNNWENPHVYMTEDCPIALKKPTLDGHMFTGWSWNDVMTNLIPSGSAMPLTFTATFEEKKPIGMMIMFR